MGSTAQIFPAINPITREPGRTSLKQRDYEFSAVLLHVLFQEGHTNKLRLTRPRGVRQPPTTRQKIGGESDKIIFSNLCNSLEINEVFFVIVRVF